MARFDFEGVDDLMKELDMMQVERIAPIMLEEAVPILESTVRRKAAVHKVSGEMLRSIKKSKADRTQTGYYICVRPTGKDAKGVRNMEKMAYMEYGTGKQKATPVLTPAVNEAEERVTGKMQEVFDRETGE